MAAQLALLVALLSALLSDPTFARERARDSAGSNRSSLK